MGYVFDAMRKAREQATPAPQPPPQPQPDTAAGPLPLTAPPAAATTATPRDDRPNLVLAQVDDRLLALVSPSHPVAEEYRTLRSALLAKWEQKRHLVHVLTSATPQEGKTITSLNLAASFAELRNRQTIVIEADLRLPQFGRLLGLPHGPGLVDVLRGEATADQATLRLAGGLWLIPAGKRAGNDTVQLLSGAPMTRLIKELRARFDHVIIDTPPVVGLADAGILGAQADEVMLVARTERTPLPLVEQAVRSLQSYGCSAAGVIATDVRRQRRRYYNYAYRYGYAYRSRAYTQAA